MTLRSFTEQQTYRLDDLSNAFGVDTSKAKDILQRLILIGAAKIAKSEIPAIWENDDSPDGFIWDNLARDLFFTITFVGIIEIDGYTLKCYPKFIKDRIPGPSDLRPILQAIERYNADHTELNLTVDSSPRIRNRLALGLAILRDYFSHGLYVHQREELNLHGQGEIDWETSISTTTPLIRNNRPYYFDYFTNDIRQDDTDYISRLHACIITECSKKLHACELDEILQLEAPTLYNGERIDFGTNDYICQRLRGEINIQFVSHKQMLLRNLLAWIENAEMATGTSGIRMFGTNTFHVLWETMCAEVFESQYTHTLNSLGVALDSTFNSGDTLESLICKPKWQATIGGSPHEAMKTLRPDYIRIVKDTDRNHFVILDAKYYNIELDENHVSGQPGVEDVSKQYLYHLAYKDFIRVHGMNPINAFISPSDQSVSSVVGKAMMPIFSNLPAIRVVKLSASKILRNYNNHTHLSLQEEIPALFSDFDSRIPVEGSVV